MNLTLPSSLAYGASFFLFGTLNNVLYVVSHPLCCQAVELLAETFRFHLQVILSAALDLVDQASTPKVSHYFPLSLRLSKRLRPR